MRYVGNAPTDAVDPDGLQVLANDPTNLTGRFPPGAKPPLRQNPSLNLLNPGVEVCPAIIAGAASGGSRLGPTGIAGRYIGGMRGAIGTIGDINTQRQQRFPGALNPDTGPGPVKLASVWVRPNGKAAGSLTAPTAGQKLNIEVGADPAFRNARIFVTFAGQPVTPPTGALMVNGGWEIIGWRITQNLAVLNPDVTPPGTRAAAADPAERQGYYVNVSIYPPGGGLITGASKPVYVYPPRP